MVQNNQSHLTRRLLATTILMIATNAVLTLIAQPASYWISPRTAIRFDALAIHSSTNPMFDFFLGHGGAAYLGGVALYAAAVWLMATLLPDQLAIVAELTVILGLCYCGSNWIAVRWNTGTGGAILYTAAVAIVLANVTLPSTDEGGRNGLRRLCWLMALTTAIDAMLTLIGQPASYWRNAATVHEGNPVARYFLEIGWWAYAAYILAWIAVPWLIASRVSRLTGWALAFAMMLGGLYGGSNWLFYEDRLGLQGPVIYGMLLSILIVRFVLNPGQRETARLNSANDAPGHASMRVDEVKYRRTSECC